MPKPFSEIYNSDKFRSLSPDDQDFIIRDYYDTVVTPQVKAKGLAQEDADFIRNDYFNKYKPLTQQQPKPEEPNLFMSTLTGLGKGLGRGVTAEGYNPEIQQGEEGAVAVGDFVATAGVNILPYLAGPGAGLAVNTTYAGARELNRELNQGKRLDQLNPVAIGGQAALGALTSKLPPAVGRGLITRVLTGTGMGAATCVSGRAIEQWADTGKVDFSDPSMMQAALFGGTIGGGVGAMSRPRAPRIQPKPQPPIQESPIGLKPLRVVESPRVETKVTGRILKPEEAQGIQQQVEAPPTQEPSLEALFSPDEVQRIREAHGQLGNINPTHTINTPERQQLRTQLTDELYGSGAPRKERRIDLVLGLPASGKSSALVEPLAKEHGAIIIDSDAAKERLPEFQGGVGAGAVHEESTQIAANLLGRAFDNGDNIVHPVVGRDLDKLRAMIQNFQEDGYQVHLHHVDLPSEEAARRAYNRYLETGRFVDPEYVLGVGMKPKENFAILVDEGVPHGYSEYSNDVPRGQQPTLIRKGEADPARLRPQVSGGSAQRQDDLRLGQRTDGFDPQNVRGSPQSPQASNLTPPKANIYQVPLQEIQTDTARFQRRAAPFNEEHVNRIAQNFDEARLSPLTVWKDPATGETLLLSGHHRLEALKRVGKGEAPVKYFEGTEEQARDLATSSNAQHLEYSDLEKARIIAEDMASGKKIDEVSKQLGLSVSKTREIATLNNLHGDWVTHYDRPEVKPYALTIAKASHKYGLSELEQQQLFQFLFQGDNAASVTPSKLNQLIELSHNYKQTLGGTDGEVPGQSTLFDTQVFQQTTGNALENLLAQSGNLNKQLKAIASLQKQLDKMEKSELVQPKSTRILRSELAQAQAKLEQQLQDIGFEFQKPNQTQELATSLKQTQANEPIPIRNLKASARQAQEAKQVRKQRAKAEQAGHMLNPLSARPRLRSPFEPVESQAFNPQDAQVKDPLGSTRQTPSLLDNLKEGLKDNFNYLHAVKNKTWQIGLKKVQGERFIAEVDRLRSQKESGYKQAEGKIKNAIEHLEDAPGYSAKQKLDDATRYLLLSDYVRRGQEGLDLPQGMTLDEARESLQAITGHIRQHTDVRKTVVHVRQLLNEIGDDLVKAGILETRRKQYFPHQVLEYLQETYGLPSHVKYPKRGYTVQAKGSEKEIETDLITALEQHLKAIARHNAVDGFINRTLKEYALPNWKAGQKLPDGFVEYQPKTGRNYFEAYTIPEQSVMNATLEALMVEKSPKVTVPLNRVRKVLAVGQELKSYAIPEEIGRYMNQLTTPQNPNEIQKLVTSITRTWKGFVTANPINVFGLLGYNLKNAFGDFEAALRDDPGLTKYLGRAIREIMQAKGGKPSKEFLTAEEWGTIGAGYYGSELGLKGDFHFSRRFSDKPLDKALTRTPGVSEISKLGSKINQGVMDLQTAREDILRYAKFLKDMDQGLEPWQAHIANGKTFVNYNHLTDFEKRVFRDALLPFYTFYKYNLLNWGAAFTGQRGGKTAARAYGLALGVPLMGAIWNNIQYGDIEQEIQDNKGERYIAETPHIITPFKDSRGNHYILLFPTASAQALQFAGLSRLPQHLVKAVSTGKVTEEIKGQIGDFFSRSGRKGDLPLPAPLVEALELSNPHLKEGAEQLFNWDLYLDRPIAREGDDVPDSEKAGARLAHLGKTVFPPGLGPKLQNLTSPHKDPSQKLLDLTGVVKTPDIYSWSDLKEEERAFQDENIRVKTPELNSLKEQIKQARFDESNDLIFNTQFDEQGQPTEQGKRYGQLLKPSQRIRVKTLLESVQQGNGLSYKGLLKDLKALDAAYQQAGPEQKTQLNEIKQSILSDLETLKQNRTKRLQYAVQTVLLEDDPKEQNAIFKELTQD